MRFLESATVLPAPSHLSTDSSIMRLSAVDSRTSPDVGRHSNTPPSGLGAVLTVGGARRPVPSRLGAIRVLLAAGLLLDRRSVLGLWVLYPRGLLALARVLADRAAGAPVLGARLLFPCLRRGATLYVAALGRDALLGVPGRFFGLSCAVRRLGEIGVALAGEVLEHLPDQGDR